MRTSLIYITLMSSLITACAWQARASHIPDTIAMVFDDGEGHQIPYHLFLPPGHDQPDSQFPLVLFLHGSGERGSDNELHLKYISGMIRAVQSDRYASYMLAPQVPDFSDWSEQRDVTIKLLEEVQSHYNVDADRLYVTGLSMGGFGTLDFLVNHPDLFAAGVPLSGGWIPEDAPLIKDIPIWIFHGAQDESVPVELSRIMNEALLAAGGSPRYTEIPMGTHNIWNSVYRDDDNVLYPWLFNQSTNRLARHLGPSAVYAVQDNDSDAVFDDLGDTALDQMANPRQTVGEADAATNNRLVRVIAKFALPDTPNPIDRLQSATLRFFVEGIEGIPAGPLSLLYSLSDNDSDFLASDYEDASYMDTLLDLVQPSDLAGSNYELDVTDLVLADYLSDGASPLSAFRLQINEASFFEDNLSNRYLLTMPGAEVDRPQLVLTFIPEPPTSLLGAMALLGVLGFRRRLGATGFASVRANRRQPRKEHWLCQWHPALIERLNAIKGPMRKEHRA